MGQTGRAMMLMTQNHVATSCSMINFDAMFATVITTKSNYEQEKTQFKTQIHSSGELAGL